MLYSAVLIIEDSLREQADAMGAAMGWGPVSYTIPLVAAQSPEDSPEDRPDEPITHWACRLDVPRSDIAAIRAEGEAAPALQDHGTVLQHLVADFSPDPDAPADAQSALWGHAHLGATLARLSLRMHRQG